MLKLPILNVVPKHAPSQLTFRELPNGVAFMYNTELAPHLGKPNSGDDFGSIFIKLNSKAANNCVKFERFTDGFAKPEIVSFGLDTPRHFFKVELFPRVAPEPSFLSDFLR